jgi:general secretion pathway protein A
MDVPLLLQLSLPGTTGHRYLALVSLEDGSASISPPLAGRSTLTLNELRELWFGHGYILWKNSMNLPYLLNPGMTGPGVAGVQRLLQETGVFGGEVDGTFDEETVSAVTAFQRRRGIAQDGRVGPQTLLLLYQEAQDEQTPRLGAAKQGGRR